MGMEGERTTEERVESGENKTAMGNRVGCNGGREENWPPRGSPARRGTEKLANRSPSWNGVSKNQAHN